MHYKAILISNPDSWNSNHYVFELLNTGRKKLVYLSVDAPGAPNVKLNTGDEGYIHYKEYSSNCVIPYWVREEPTPEEKPCHENMYYCLL